MSQITASDGLKIIINSKRNETDKMVLSSAIGVVCRVFSLVYFIVMELFSFGLSLLINNCIIACRISLVLFLVMTILFVVLVVYVSKAIKSGWEIRRQHEAENTVRDNKIPELYFEDDEDDSPAEIENEDKQMRDIIQNQLESFKKEAEQNFIIESFDRTR